MAETTENPKPAARKGMNLLKSLIFEGEPAARNQRHDDPRQTVAGEVVIVEMAPGGEQSGKHRVFIRDLSKGGCGLWSRVRIEPGTSILVLFQGPDGQPVQRVARVRHCRGQEGTGFAVGVQIARDSDGPKAGKGQRR